jgi:hypothetical protein
VPLVKPSNPSIPRNTIFEGSFTTILHQASNLQLQLQPRQGESTVCHVMNICNYFFSSDGVNIDVFPLFLPKVIPIKICCTSDSCPSIHHSFCTVELQVKPISNFFNFSSTTALPRRYTLWNYVVVAAGAIPHRPVLAKLPGVQRRGRRLLLDPAAGSLQEL